MTDPIFFPGGQLGFIFVDEEDFHKLLFYYLSYVMVVDVNVFGPFFSHWVRGDEYQALIIPTYQYRFEIVAKLPHKGMHPDCENYAVVPSFSSIFLYLCKTSCPKHDCQECLQNSALFAQFLLSFLTYVLLSYFVRLHCANIHILLPSFSFLMT